jgi:aspartyl-tRNA(Asn)/glutamyl-tRNA(Gln) amidotransferase subunit A
MGSVRIPAAYCGVYGFKPANAEISQDGVEPCEPALDAVGLLARHLRVLKEASALCGGGGGWSTPASGRARVMTIANLGGVDCHPDVLAAFDRARSTIGIDDAIDLPHPLSRVRFAGFIATARALSTAFADSDPALLSDRFRRLISYGPRRSDADWAADQDVLRDTALAMREAVVDGNILLLPTTPGLAFPLANDAPANQADFTCLANIADLPALSFPVGLSDGLPVGLQMICASGAEGTMFDLAGEIAAYHRPHHFLKGA